MKTKSEKMLPKTEREIQNGGLYAQAVRCGKPTCKCSRGETHSAFYFFTRRKGKLIKIYVRKAEVEEFARLVARASLERYARRQMAKTNTQLLRGLRQSLYEKQGFINSLRGI
jgi:hypothetical protein